MFQAMLQCGGSSVKQIADMPCRSQEYKRLVSSHKKSCTFQRTYVRLWTLQASLRKGAYPSHRQLRAQTKKDENRT